MSRKDMGKRKREYDEMERCCISASFRRPPYHLTAARMEKKEKRDGTGKKKDGRADAEKLGTGRPGTERDIGSGA